MKRIISLVLALTLIFAFASCAKPVETETEVNEEIQAYLDKGYDFTMTGSNDTTWAGLLVLDESYIKVTAPMTAERQALLDALDISDVDYDTKENELIATFLDATCEDISSMVPTQEDLDAYIGKTLGEMEEEGFMYTEWGYSEDSYVVQIEGPTYIFNVTVDADINGTNIDNYSENDKREFKIATAEFVEFSFSIFGLD